MRFLAEKGNIANYARAHVHICISKQATFDWHANMAAAGGVGQHDSEFSPVVGECRDVPVIDKTEMERLVKEKVFSESWRGGNVTYGLLKLLFEAVEKVVGEEGGREDELVRRPLLILDQNIVLPKNISNLKRALRNKNINFSSDVAQIYVKSGEVSRVRTNPYWS